MVPSVRLISLASMRKTLGRLQKPPPATRQARRIRIVAVFTSKRLAVLPNIQTASETFSSLIAVLFTGLFAPAATPKAIIDQIAQANRTAMGSEDFKSKLVAAGLEPVLDTPQEAQRSVEAENARLIPLVKSIGFKLK